MMPPVEVLEQGIACFNRREFFEAHEVWETLWRATPGPERALYQGLIQVAVACLHLTRGNAAGARYELAQARGHLAPFLPSAQGIPLTELLESVERCLIRGSSAAFPTIQGE